METRGRLGIPSDGAIDPITLVESKGCLVWTPQDVPELDICHIRQLTISDPDSWDAVTIKEGNCTVIVINNTRPAARQSNTIMHEWAHLELKHKPSRVDQFENGLLLLSDYPKEFEDEADWLSGAMLAPREGLLSLRRRGMDDAQIAETFRISSQLATWRIRMTGIDRQFSRRY
ncbi:ImmA/IrrE family metallo-endopeptidase [Vannielia litorea]|uniref:ImmA/IrrE family metallo-endopeptidase n=1 Tax=Vannielia litorea TaxID=1217970 RepID=UPI0021BD7601|nr:ImmA/IrrE family metallo-endopeptidase [Vannielia litorea]